MHHLYFIYKILYIKIYVFFIIIYVSLSATKPQSTSEMFKVEEFKNGRINTVTGMFRWICAVYSDDSEVNEGGLVSSPFLYKE